MNSSPYSIKRWDPLIFGNDLAPYPSIYIEPDTEFLDFIRANQSSIICKISGTGTAYDGKLFRGLVYKSNATPSCASNFYAETGLYIISLMSFWYGYPPPTNLGQVHLFGVKSGVVPAGSQVVIDEKVENYQEKSLSSGCGCG